MTTITFDEEIKIEKTHFKKVEDFISVYKRKNIENKENTNLVGWTNDEIKEFEKNIMINDFEKMSEEEKNIDWSKIFIKGTKYNS